MSHALERTSPKGEGQTFIGRCIKCGAEGLTSTQLWEACINPSGMSDADAFLDLLQPVPDVGC